MDAFGPKTVTWYENHNDKTSTRRILSRSLPSFTGLSCGYLIIGREEKGECGAANKRCLNKLARGHIIQTVGIVLGPTSPDRTRSSRGASPGDWRDFFA